MRAAITRYTIDLLFDVIIAILFTAVYASGFYKDFPAPLQLVAFKVLLVSLAVIHAHIVGKILFGPGMWRGPDSACKCGRPGRLTPSQLARIMLYALFIYAYSTGG